MRFLTLLVLFISLSLVSCGRRYEGIKRDNRKGRQKSIQLVNNEVNVGIVQKVSLNVIRTGHSRRKIQPICRGIDGCLSVCEYFEYPKCKQLSAKEVVSFWLNKIDSYKSWEQARNDLDLIATNLEVPAFLKNVDKNNRVVQSLFSLNTSANCPRNDAQNIIFRHSPAASLYLGVSEPAVVGAVVQSPPGVADGAVAKDDDGAVVAPPAAAGGTVAKDDGDGAVVQSPPAADGAAVKKIVDGAVIHFDLQLFAGFIKNCFGHNSRTFSEMAVQIENKDAFEIGHEVLSKSCSENSECIRLAYCTINSDLVWAKLPEGVKAPGCEYDSFVEMLP